MTIPKTNNPNNKKLKFLVIDDDKTIRTAINLKLSSLFDCIVYTVATGDEGVELASYELFNLIFTDIDLGGGINGITTAKKIRRREKNKTTPIIAISGNSQAKQQCLDMGINAFLSKPFTKEEFIAILKQCGFVSKST